MEMQSRIQPSMVHCMDENPPSSLLWQRYVTSSPHGVHQRVSQSGKPSRTAISWARKGPSLVLWRCLQEQNSCAFSSSFSKSLFANSSPATADPFAGWTALPLPRGCHPATAVAPATAGSATAGCWCIAIAADEKELTLNECNELN